MTNSGHLRDVLKETRRTFVDCGCNQTHVADALDIPRSNMWSWLKKIEELNTEAEFDAEAPRHSFHFVELALAQSAYGAQRVKDANCIAIELIKKVVGQVAFQVLMRPRTVERSFA